MRQMSIKRRKNYAKYVEVRERLRQRLRREGKYFCVFCISTSRPLDPEADCHHLLGRDEDLLFDEEFLSFAHGDCHHDYHSKPHDKLWWFPLFLKNLRNQWPKIDTTKI